MQKHWLGLLKPVFVQKLKLLLKVQSLGLAGVIVPGIKYGKVKGFVLKPIYPYLPTFKYLL